MTASKRTWTDTAKATITTTDWDKTLTDGGIYLLGLGGFYVGYQVLHTQALAVGFPQDQAVVVAALADLAILLYSRKAVREVRAGRSARVIRTLVALFSLATFGLQLRDAWPDPLSVTFHALPPAVWIIGHEMMLRGDLRDAKAAKRDQQIADGLRPAPLPAIRLTWWLLDPFHTFKVWRRTKLWEVPQEAVIRHEATKLQAKNKDIPLAWQRVLLDTPADNDEPEARTRAQQDSQKQAAFAVTLYRQSSRDKVPTDEMMDFLAALPPAPAEGRPLDKARDYVTLVEQEADTRDIKVTGVFLGALLGVDPSYISRLKKAAPVGA
ncbi:DUF2637 domain-containing protein [Streptomyces sp. MH60]|uniref:DUF2637 domain-containing protein n=1 Tax=Streptomyces sp. MH60 TaxID=1940758 RepID=UPI000CEE26D4|nr:DUF2637 domain-containing protein [Streptomyces sp. MH60]PPS89546.1 hypothetical protein BZZ08_01693 [Streptomyces sp. MH60]